MHVELRKSNRMEKKKETIKCSGLSCLFSKKLKIHMAGKYQPQLNTILTNMFKSLLVLKTEVIKFLEVISLKLLVLFVLFSCFAITKFLI